MEKGGLQPLAELALCFGREPHSNAPSSFQDAAILEFSWGSQQFLVVFCDSRRLP